MCVKPLKGYRSASLNESGKRGIVFKAKDGYVDMPVEVPCGRCIECRLERTRQWAMRCVHEASLYEDNCFITLTYDADHLPADRSINVRDLQLFFKRLRKKFPESKIRYFACGEYGEQSRRPHYHAVVFNFDFLDKRILSGSGANRLFSSADLEEVWGKGLCTVGTVTFDSAAYVAGYCVKKVSGDRSEEHYTLFDGETGEVISILKPEFAVMSRRPGIGKGWFDQFHEDIYSKDYIHMRGAPMGAPRTYDKWFEKMSPERLRSLKDQRVRDGKKRIYENSYDGQVAREKVKHAKFNLKKRAVE